MMNAELMSKPERKFVRVYFYILGKAVFANSDPPPKYPVLG